MEKSEQKKLVSRLNEVAAIIGRKGKTYMEPGYIFTPYVPISENLYARKKIMFVKEWLEQKRTNHYIDVEAELEKMLTNHYGYHSIDAEAELTKMLTEELAKEIEKEKTINQSWTNKNIRGLDC